MRAFVVSLFIQFLGKEKMLTHLVEDMDFPVPWAMPWLLFVGQNRPALPRHAWSAVNMFLFISRQDMKGQ